MGCYKNGNLVGGMVLQEPKPLTPFQGVLVRNTEGKYTTQMSLENEVCQALAEIKHPKFFNHYNLVDVRQFLWAGYSPILKYTYVVEPNWDRCEKDTKWMVLKHKFNDIKENDFDTLDALYTLTFERKGMTRPVSTEFLRNMCDLPFTEIYTTEGAGVVLIKDTKRYYYIIGASDGEGTSSFLLWNAIKDKKEVDVVGCNNCKIGMFKRGFGGQLKPYFGLTL
jgi:hypothetical protein